MKQIKVEKYNTLTVGKTYLFSNIQFKPIDKTMVEISYSNPEKGKLIKATSKKHEVVEDEKPTGKFKTVGDIVVYEPIDKYYDYNGEKLKIHKTIVGCGLFKIYNYTPEDIN